MSHLLKGNVAVDDASKWIGEWLLSNHQLKANCFTFNADEFRELLNEKHVEKVRLYLALEITHDGTQQVTNEKLLAVGIDKDGMALINPVRKAHSANPPGSSVSADADPGNDGSGIYDFSHPCPPICG